jgi:hypothetical protein
MNQTDKTGAARGANANGRNSKFVPASVVAIAKKALTEQPAITPVETSLRQAVNAMYDEIMTTRNKGHSWEAVVTLLADCNIEIKAATLRTYVYEIKRIKDDDAKLQTKKMVDG